MNFIRNFNCIVLSKAIFTQFTVELRAQFLVCLICEILSFLAKCLSNLKGNDEPDRVETKTLYYHEEYSNNGIAGIEPAASTVIPNKSAGPAELNKFA